MAPRGRSVGAPIGYVIQAIKLAALAFVIGVVIQRVVIRPVERAPILSVVTVFIGLLVIFNSVAGWIFTYTIKSFPSPFPSEPPFGLKFISSHALGSTAVTLVLLLLLQLVVLLQLLKNNLNSTLS